MDIPGARGYPPSDTKGQGGSFAESLRKESNGGAVSQRSFASSKSFVAGDLATDLAFMSPDFMPQMGEGMLDAIARAEGANDEMRRYEEEANRR